MRKIIILFLLLILGKDIFAQIKGIQRIGATTLRDSSNQLSVDKNLRTLKDLTVEGNTMLKGIVTGDGIASFGSVNAAHFYFNDESFSDVFGKMSNANDWYRVQGIDTINFGSTFNLNHSGFNLFQITSDNKWYADHYEFFTKGVKRVTIDDDSNKIKIYSGPNQISLWNNNGVLDINAPVISHGGFEAQDLDVKKNISISGVLTSISMDIVNDTLFADSGMVFTKTLSGNTSFKLHGINDGQTIKVAVTNTTANYTVSWSISGSLHIFWPDETTPMQTVGDHVDIYTFQRIGADVFGSVIQNYK